MTQNIATQIENINKSLEWIKKNKTQDYEQKFLQLVEERRKLKKLLIANEENPAIAAFGVSQVGKSYLMNCILQRDGKPFIIEADGNEYKFIEEMNPKTNGVEATGVVTRFSSFSRNPERHSDRFPILMKCLSVADIIIVISEGYYHDVTDYTTYSEADITKYGEEIYNKYRNMPTIANSPITADAILDIRAYFNKHINHAQAYLHTSFFDQLALVANRIPEDDWVDIFSILWRKSEFQNKLFSKILSTLSKLQYSKYVYLPAQALLHNGINENTIMSVDCLNNLFLKTPIYFTDAYLKRGETYERIADLTKSEVCAVCAEIIVRITDEYLDCSNQYSMINIKDERVIDEITKGRTKIEKKNAVTGATDITYEKSVNVLKNNDLLDFPGARSRLELLLETLCKDAQLISVLLRGKVAYLFNTYNESMLINVLLYCHHAEQHDVSDMPLLLNEWIRNYIGDTMEKRKRTLELTDGISPFFYIATKFNMDMKYYKNEDIKNSINCLNNRWQDRFEKVLYKQCLNVDGSLDAQKKTIFSNWTRPDENFMNSYLLRDFNFSGPGESELYDCENTDERRMTIPEEHYRNLRETFCSNEHVRRFFKFPELSWDICASIDNDGTQFIISQLDKVAARMDATRDEQFKSMLASISRTIINLMDGYYISTDIDEMLESNIRKAKNIFREMDFTCNADNYYFGHLLQALQISETTCYRTIHAILQSHETIATVNDFTDYEIIRNSCVMSGHPIESAKNDEEKWECIINTYSFGSLSEANEFLAKKQINIRKLFDGTYKRKLNSCIVADAVYDKWCSSIKSIDFMNSFSSDKSFDVNIMTSLVDNLITSANMLSMRDRMAQAIAEYVNVIKLDTVNENMLADTLASMINDFVLDFGFKYIDAEDINKIKNICKSRGIPAFNYIERESKEVYDNDEIAKMFNYVSSNPQAILPSFDDNYYKWLEYMFISFVAHLDVPEFDHKANLELANIMDCIKKIS